MSDDGSSASNCLCEDDYECDFCGSQLGARIAEHEAEFVAAASPTPEDGRDE
jgi:hypothetical protein